MNNPDTIEHNEMFDLAYRFVTETSENIFLTGKAGTGKTTFLKYLKNQCSKNMVITAPTGVAAINAGGVTLHSLFQLPFHPFIPTKNNRDELLTKIRFNKQRYQMLRRIELLVIDEISMVRCDVLDAIDTVLKSVRSNYNAPFGGVQLLCIGDLYQLPPVARRQEWDILQEFYSSPFFFDSIVIKQQMPLLIELDKIYRQKDDSFVALLNKVRNNIMDGEDFKELHLRHNPSFRPSKEENYITLTSHNSQADLINTRELQQLPVQSFTYTAVIQEDFPKTSFPAESSLVLKVGAQVMFLKNDALQKKYFNGKIGVVKSLKEGEIVVTCDGINIYVAPETWENLKYAVNKAGDKLQQQILGTFTQFPLRLAWAITIHKSQGLTFEKVLIDAGLAFSSGQVYVALSRCTNLGGIVLLSRIPSEAIHSNDNVVKAQRALTHKGSLADKFDGARQFFTKQLLHEIFSFNEAGNLFDALSKRVKEHQAKLIAEWVGWLESFKVNLDTDKKTSFKFLTTVTELMKQEAVIEHNIPLQKRINDAASYFEKKLAVYQLSLQDHPLLSEHRETANKINEPLNQLMMGMYTMNYYLQYCRQPFSVTSFLHHKLKFAHAPFTLSCYAGGKKQFYTETANAELYDLLKNWRDELCEQTNMPIYMVANRVSITEISTYLPFKKSDLVQLSGFGKAKVDKFGDQIVKIVRDYCSEKNLESNMSSKGLNTSVELNGFGGLPANTKSVSYQLFQEGRSISEIARERNFANSTIEGHLAWYVGTGLIDIDKLVTPEKQVLVKDAVKLHGTSNYKLIKESVPEDITYGELKFVLASCKEIAKTL